MTARARNQYFPVSEPAARDASDGPERSPRMATTCRRLLRPLAAAALSLMLAFAPTAPAQAQDGLLACVNAAFPAQGFADAAKLAADVAGCTGQLAGGDAVMAASVATMTALAAAGLIPTNTQQCYAAIDKVIGKILAEALQQAGLADALGLSQSDLDQLINGQATLHQLAGSIPAVQLLLGYANCGCKIVGAPDAAKQIADNYLADAAGCADFIAGALTGAIDWFETAICDVLDTIGLCNPAGGGDQTCYTGGQDAMSVQHAGAPPSGRCELGMQCNPCGFTFCSAVDPRAIGITPGVCGCPVPYTSNYNTDASATNTKLKSCTCESPNISIGSGSGAACVCPINEQLKDGACSPCSASERYVPAEVKTGTSEVGSFEYVTNPRCESCALGYKANESHTACVSACNADEILENGVCKACPYGAGALHMIGSLGSCCAPGQKADAAQNKCVPACGEGQIFDLKTLACTGCPAGSVAATWNPSVSIGACAKCPQGLTSYDSKTCSCPLGTYAKANYVKGPHGTVIKDVTCAPGVPPGTVVKTPADLICSPGMIRIGDAGCMCPAGSRRVGDKCIPLVSQSVPAVRRDCAALGPAFINNPRNAAQCIRCGGGRVANEAHNSCVAKPVAPGAGGVVVAPRIKRRGDTSLNPQPEPPMKRLSCPPRTRPNVTGTGCVPQLGMPALRRPGAAPPAGGRRFPGLVAPVRR